MKENKEAKVVVVSVGNGGSNIAGSILKKEKMQNIEFIVIDTDTQALQNVNVENYLRIGKETTKGLGTKGDVEIGRQAAEESKTEIRAKIEHADLLYIVVGMGGGTGTGAAAVIAEIAKELDILTVAVSTMPFSWEGKNRMNQAKEGYRKLNLSVNTTVVIPNDLIKNMLNNNEKNNLKKAFEKVDDLVFSTIDGLSELIITPGLVNIELKDLAAYINVEGGSMIGIGHAEGKDSAKIATLEALNHSQLPKDLKEVKTVVVSIFAGEKFNFDDLDETMKIVEEHTEEKTETIFGVIHKKDFKEDEIKVSVLATGFKEDIDAILEKAKNKILENVE